MDMYRRFNKADLENNLNQFFSNQNSLQSDSHRRYDVSSWEMSNRRNDFSYDRPWNNSSFSNDNGERQCIRNQEYIPNSYRENTHRENNCFNSQSSENNYFNSQSSKNNYLNNQYLRDYGTIDSNSLPNYNRNNEHQFTNNEIYPPNRGDQRLNYTSYDNSRNLQQMQRHHNEYSPRQESRFNEIHNESNGTSNSYQEFHQHYRRNYNRENSLEFKNDFRDNKMVSENFDRFDREFNDDFGENEFLPRESNGNDIGRIHSRDSNQIENLDDGFVCIKNPEYFPELQETDINNSKESRRGRRDLGVGRKVSQMHSRDSISPANNIRSRRRSLSSNYNEMSNARSEENMNFHSQRNTFYNHSDNHQRSYERNKRDNHHERNYNSERKKYNEYRRENDFIYENELKMSNSKETLNERNNYRKDKNYKTKRVSFSNSSFTQREAERNVSESSRKGIKVPVDLQNRKDNKMENNAIIEKNSIDTTQKPSTSEAKKQKKIEKTKLFLAHMRNKNKKMTMYRHKIALKTKEKKKELKEAGILGRPSKGRTKFNPDKYWKNWWSKYYYIEDIIEKVDANDNLVRNFIKFRYDINDPDLDNHVREVYQTGMNMLKKISNINETNYERRIDAFKMMKYKKIMESKDFQSYTLPRECKMLNSILLNLNNHKVKLALLYQSVIHKWHSTKRLLNKEDQGSPEQLKYAKYIQNLKLFHYLVFDAIQELKKITSSDWPEFNEFYNNLKS